MGDSMTDPLKEAKDGVVTEVIKAATENPQVREAGANLSQAALTITKTINNALLPLAALNFAVEKARTYFAERFQAELLTKAAAIPVDEVVEPKASIAGPALQGLAFAHEEPNLKDMYLSLLTTAMDGRVTGNAHPAFVEVIRQLESEEARLLRTVLRSPGLLSIVDIRLATVNPAGYRKLVRHVMNLCEIPSGTPFENPNLPAMVDNWIRLGLVEVEYGKYLTNEDAYAWVEGRPEYKRLKAEHETDTEKLIFERGVIGKTSFGSKFAGAAGLLDDAPASSLIKK